MQEAAVRYVKESLQPTDSIAVFLLGSGLRLLQDFTNDKDRLIEALQIRDISGRSLASLESPPSGVGDHDRVARTFQEVSGSGAAGGPAPGEATSELAQAAIGLRIERMFFNLRTFVQEREARGTLLAIQAIANVTGQLEGRKTLVLFSEGFVIGPHVEGAMEKTIQMANRANLAVYGIDSQGLATGALSAARIPQGELGAVSAESEGSWITGRRKDASGGLSVFDRAKEIGSDARDSALRHLSTATGGFSIRHTNDLRVGMKRIDEDIRGHYLIGYRPRNQSLDGSFRNIRIEILREAHTARHRSGYAALPDGMEILTVEDFQLLAAAQSGELPLDLPAHFRIEQFAGRGLERNVLISLEIPAGGIEFREVQQEDGARHLAELEVVGLLSDEAGRALMRFGTPMLLGFSPQELAEIKDGGLSFNNKTELLSGTYSFQVLVRDLNSSRAALMERPVRIPPPAPGLSLSSVVLGKRVEAASADVELLTVGDSVVVPSASRTFSNGENLIYFFEVYPGPETEAISLRLSVRRSGAQTSIELPAFQIAALAERTKIAVSRYIELEGLPPGTYLLAVQAEDERAGATAQTQTSFSVVSRTGN